MPKIGDFGQVSTNKVCPFSDVLLVALFGYKLQLGCLYIFNKIF